MFQRLLFAFLLLVALSTVPVYAVGGDDVPAWLRQAAATSAPTYRRDVPAVVLLNEQTVSVGEDGRLTNVTTYAVRILTREGRGYATAVEHYDTANGKVREMRAWLLRPDGTSKRYGGDAVADVVTNLNDVYNESRMKLINAADDAEVGTVFGYQTTSEDRSLFPQDTWNFQNRLPALVSR